MCRTAENPQSRDTDLPDPACEPDNLASIMGIEDIETQAFCIKFLAELRPSEPSSSKRKLIPLFSGTLLEQEVTKEIKKEIAG